jgi:hypothetical protein
MTVAYLTRLPSKFIRMMGGWKKKPGSFSLPRGDCPPPQSLSRQVFPWIEAWLARVEACACGKTWNDGGLAKDDGAAAKFLNLMQYLRVVLLQDLAVLQPGEFYSSLPLLSATITYFYSI